MSLTDRDLLRHALAVLAYRGAKPLCDAPASFASFDSGGGHTPLVILAHLGDLLDWALSHARGQGRWKSDSPGSWEAESARFFAALAALDAYLASDAPLGAETTRLLQGPIADALTHVGQLMMLRRMSGAPVYGENYFVADIVTGRVGPEQSPPKRPF
jgi:hypothetical protein